MQLGAWHRTVISAGLLAAVAVLVARDSETPAEPSVGAVSASEAPAEPTQEVEIVEIPLFIRSQVYTPYYAVRDSQGEGSKPPAFPFRKVEFSTRIDVDAARLDKRGHVVPESR